MSDVQTFVQMCLLGKASPSQIDEFVEKWHRSEGREPLHEFLGLSADEYAQWVSNPSIIDWVIEARKQGPDRKSLEAGFERSHASIVRLVRDFRGNEASFLSPEYPEAEVRKDFIDKFWTALGWDVTHERQKNPYEQEVHVERAVQVGTRKKRCDYAFYVAPNFRDERFFVEAKKPQRTLTSPDDFFQTIRYSYNRGAAVSVLTDFANFHILDCRSKPNIATALSSSVEHFWYDAYEDKEQFARIYFLFARPAVAAGSLDRFTEGLPTKARRNRAAPSIEHKPLDESFLEDLDEYRLELARAFKASNPGLDGPQLTEATQRALDRLIFLRFVEDKLIEPQEVVLQIAAKEPSNAWEDFRSTSKRLDTKYNGLVFKRHFIDEPEFGAPDGRFVDVCTSLSNPKSPYDFAAIGIDILGSIYERFLGKVVTATAKQVSIDLTPEARKAGGVYYTPQYVVRYLADHTVGKLIEGKTPETIAKMRFVDLACGSGSFLLGIYSHLLDYHLRYYIKNPDRAERNALVEFEGRKELSLKKRIDILLNNVFGVDLDQQAIEVTQLSLSLKLLENETVSKARQYRLAFREALLPSLTDNIVCGNALVTPEDVKLSPEEERMLKPTKLVTAFAKSRTPIQFDAVLGNPPWGADLPASIRQYLANRFSDVVVRMPDTYLYFISVALRLLKPKGFFGMILPGTLLTQADAKKARQLLLDEMSPRVIVNLGQEVFGKHVLNTSALVVAQNQKTPPRSIVIDDFRDIPPPEKGRALRQAASVDWKRWRKLVRADQDTTLFTKDLPLVALLQKLQKRCPPLAELLNGEIQRGVTPDLLEMVAVPNTVAESARLEREPLRPLVLGKDVKRYGATKSDHQLIYLTRYDRLVAYPRIAAYMEPFRKDITCPEVRDGKHPWFALHRPRDPSIFGRPKFIGLTTTRKVELVFDETGTLFATDALYLFSLKDGTPCSPSALLAILQSRLIGALYKAVVQGEQRVIPQIKAAKLDLLPIAEPSPQQARTLEQLVGRAMDWRAKADEARTDSDREYFESSVRGVASEIDAVVYDTYKLTKTDIATVDESIPT
jgi:predicted RNA methylase